MHKGLKLDSNLIERQVAFATKPDFTRREWFLAEEPCLFLGTDGECMIYNSRPIACRAVWSVSEPEICSRPDGKLQRIDNRDWVENAYKAVQNEHYQLALTPVVSALPIMVNLVLNEKLPSTLGKTGGIVGLDGEAFTNRSSPRIVLAA